ncbi:MAG: aminotransferase class V-fold PLP-dependent enzyme [Clostridia bacterium]|nr:aminotransferase class V-fold PLP-dependent enzyme [Clostridia bacterium]
MIYFDNAATGGKKPDSVLSAVSAAMKICANPGRSGHKLSVACAKLVQDCRNELSDSFNGYGFERVIFTKNCTEALNIALFGVLKKGDHVIVSCAEHNSVLRPLEKLKNDGVISYDVCPLVGDKENATLDIQALRYLLKPKTRLVAVTTASNVNGLIPDLTAVKAALPKHILLLCDGAQGAGHFPISMRESGIDLLTLAGHKGLHALQGSGALLFSERVEPRPFLYGGTGSMSVSLDMPDFYPDGLEAGTLAFPAIVSLLEGIRYTQTHLTEIQNRLSYLTQYLLERLKPLSFYQSYSLPNPCGIVAFKHEFLQSEFIASALSSVYDIALRGGLHCAPLMHEALGSLDGGLVRVSLSHFNSEREIDELIAALYKLERH